MPVDYHIADATAMVPKHKAVAMQMLEMPVRETLEADVWPEVLGTVYGCPRPALQISTAAIAALFVSHYRSHPRSYVLSLEASVRPT